MVSTINPPPFYKTIIKKKMKENTLKLSDFKKGFIYEAWIGYEWIEVEYGKNGFSKNHIVDAIKAGIVRAKTKTNHP